MARDGSYLATIARKIDGTPFDGTNDISVVASDETAVAAGLELGLNSCPNTTTGTSRVPFKTTVACCDLRFGYVNFYLNSSQIETDLTANTIKAALEVGSTIVPLTFNGQASVTMGPGATLMSDPVGVELAAGTVFFVRTYISGGNTWYANRISWTAGFGGWTATTDLTNAGAATIADSVSQLLAPTIIIGKAVGSPSVVVIGDSIMMGFGDGANNGTGVGLSSTNAKQGTGGYLSLACQGTYGAGIVNSSMQSDTAQNWVASHYRRGPLAKYARTAFVEYGVNDVYIGQTLAQMQANLITIWNQCNRRGLRTFQATISPRTSSTDGWATTANQTAASTLSVRNSLNAWLRAGAPMSGGAAAAIGTSGAAVCQVMQGTTQLLAASGPAHPLYAVADVGSLAETSTTSGIWQAPANLRTVTDAQTTNGAYNVTSTQAAWTSADVGRQITVAGVGASSGLFTDSISGLASSTEVYTYTGPSVTATGKTMVIGDFMTMDGLHPCHQACIQMAAGVPTQLFI